MEIESSGKIFLLDSEALENVTHNTIAKLLHKSLYILWFQGMKRDNILLFSSYVTLYVIKTGKSIKIIYSKITHVSCLVL